jgi:hypothetical protein
VVSRLNLDNSDRTPWFGWLLGGSNVDEVGWPTPGDFKTTESLRRFLTKTGWAAIG